MNQQHIVLDGDEEAEQQASAICLMKVIQHKIFAQTTKCNNLLNKIQQYKQKKQVNEIPLL